MHCNSLGRNKEVTFSRQYEKCDKCKSRTTTPMFAVGRLKRCWEPVPGFIPEYPYSCGNKPCYKIFDPADDVEAAVGYSTNLTVLGVLFLLIGNRPPLELGTHRPFASCSVSD